MSWIERSRALRASVPSADGLALLSSALGERVELVAPMLGGIAASVWEARTPSRRLVLKRFRVGDSHPDGEWARLQLAHELVSIPTPEPLWYDPTGDAFGMPAMALGFLPGASMLPADPDALGTLMAALHATPVPDPPPDVLVTRMLQLDIDAPLPPLIGDAVERIASIWPTLPTVLAHCDLHAGNVIVDGGAVVGIVDLSNLRLAPAGFDVGRTRCDLAIDLGGDAADRFLAAYGRVPEEQALWDALAAARAIDEADGWVDAFADMGNPLTAEEIAERATAFAEAALS